MSSNNYKNLSSVGAAFWGAGGESGWSVSSAGDVNADGISDIIIGAPGDDASSGISYVIYGQKGGVANISLGNLISSQGFKIFGEDQYSISGSSVSAAGDVNGDGISDIIIGAPNDNYETGASYVIYGHKGGLSNIYIPNLTVSKGFKVIGAEL